MKEKERRVSHLEPLFDSVIMATPAGQTLILIVLTTYILSYYKENVYICINLRLHVNSSAG